MKASNLSKQQIVYVNETRVFLFNNGHQRAYRAFPQMIYDYGEPQWNDMIEED
jgi:hypothetical protein